MLITIPAVRCISPDSFVKFRFSLRGVLLYLGEDGMCDLVPRSSCPLDHSAVHCNILRLAGIRMAEQRLSSGKMKCEQRNRASPSVESLSSGYSSAPSPALASDQTTTDVWSTDYGSAPATARNQFLSRIRGDPPDLDQWMNKSLHTDLNLMEDEDAKLDEAEVEDWIKMLNELRPHRKPNQNYICHICYETGDHAIYDCPKKDEYPTNTPYKGHKKCYGEFMCPKCKRRWSSENSWANTPMNCIKCQIPVYARKQFPLEKAKMLGKITGEKQSRSGHLTPFKPAVYI